MHISPDKYQPKEAWVVSRLQCSIMVSEKSADIYIIMDVASGYAFQPLVYLDEVPSLKEFKASFKKARKVNGTWPRLLILPQGDPSLPVLSKLAGELGITPQVVPEPYLKAILEPLQEKFLQFQSGRQGEESSSPEAMDVQSMSRGMIPDSYDPSPCVSGKKYKFCCKIIFREVVEAMVAAEEGRPAEALRWLESAKEKVGETAEVLCRYAIVHSYRSEEQFLSYLDKALAQNPKHPRSHYLLGIHYKTKGDLGKAAESYEKAIEFYPSTDKFHLNETWNNLANVYYDQGYTEKAKGAWEKALMYMPQDRVCLENLIKYIYENPNLSAELRTPSPFVARYF